MIASENKVTIIIPNYNGSVYLRRCIDSAINQSYGNIEIIVVDDGSSDGSLEIIEEYRKSDKRIGFYETPHRGPNIARGIGILHSTGEYIMFVDSDDYIDRRAAEIIVEKFKEYKDIDGIRFNYFDVKKGRIDNVILGGGVSERIINDEEVKRLLLTSYKLNSLWNQAYRKGKIANIRAFNSGMKNGEDFLANLEIHNNTKKLLVLNTDPLYYYCENPSSTTRSRERRKIVNNIVDRIDSSRIALKHADGCSASLIEEATLAQMMMIRQSVMELLRIESYKKELFLEDMRKIISADNLSFINEKCLGDAIRKKSLLMRAKHRKVLFAIREGNLGYLWKYMKRIKRIKTIIGKK